jgi:L-fuconolactonase
VDAHHHLWDPAQRDYPFLADEGLGPIRRAFGGEDYAAAVVGHGVSQSIVVQAVGSVDETRSLLAAAAASAIIAGVVGWVDLTAPDVACVLASLVAGPGGDRLVGIRHQVHDEPDDEWLLRDDVQRGLAAVAEAGLAFDLLVRTRELPAARLAVERLPSMTFVLDHCAKPEIAAGGWEPWAAELSALARHQQVACKLSGLITEADWRSWTVADLTPYVGHVVDCFGLDRIMFGSDWPVCLLAGSYARVVDALVAAAGPMKEADKAKLFQVNARRIYQLSR